MACEGSQLENGIAVENQQVRGSAPVLRELSYRGCYYCMRKVLKT